MNTVTSTDKHAVVMKAYGNACDAFSLSQEKRAKLIGVSRATYGRNTNGFKLGSKEAELQVLFIRMFRSLYALLGGDNQAMVEWFNDHNHHLQGTPKDMCFSISGLVHINDYLDAMRGKV